METDAEEHKNEGNPRDDPQEACLMCGACEILGQGCVLHAPQDAE